MATLISMKLSPAEAKTEAAPDPTPPSYPYGLSLYLDEEALGKLGLDDLPKAGAAMAVQAEAVVTSVSSSQRSDGTTSRSLNLQITALALGPKTPPKGAAEALYEGGGE